MTVGTGNLIVAIGIIAVSLILACVVYVLIYYFYPRPAWLCHSEDLAKQVARLLEQAAASITKIETDGGHEPLLKELLAAAKELRQEHIDADDWTFYYMFREYLLHGTKQAMWIFTQFDANTVVKMAPQRLAEQLCPDGTHVDDGRLGAYKATKMAPMDRFRAALGAAAAKLGTLRRIKDDSRLRASVEVLALDIVLNGYEHEIVRAYNMRRTHGFALQLNILKVYFSEVSTYIFARQIKANTWGDFGGKASKMRQTVERLWHALESAVDSKRQQMLSESFSPPPPPPREAENDQSKPEIREHFFLAAIVPVFALLGDILQLIFMFFKKLSLFVKDPIAFFVWVWEVVFLTVLGIILKVFGAFFLALFSSPLAYVVVLCWCVLLTVMWIAIYLNMLVLLVVLTVLDMATGGALLLLIRCERPFDAWAHSPSFKDGNVFRRFFLCFRPCAAGYRPKSVVCSALPRSELELCPHQYIYKALYADGAEVSVRTKTTPVAASFRPDSSFWSLTDEKKKKTVEKFYDGVAEYVGGCKDAYEGYDPIVRSLCANLDGLIDAADGRKKVLKELCKQVYCEFADKEAEFCVPDEAKPPLDQKNVDYEQIVTWILASALTMAVLVALFATLFRLFGGRADVGAGAGGVGADGGGGGAGAGGRLSSAFDGVIEGIQRSLAKLTTPQ